MREADASDLNYNNFLGATATLASAGYLGVEVSGIVIIFGVAASLTKGTIANAIFSAYGFYGTDFTKIVNPDPGRGEGYVI